MARRFAFVSFTQGSPLNFAQHYDIPLAALKSLPNFTGETQTTTFEHIRDIATLCKVHHVTEEDIVKLLAASLKRKALQCFRSLTVGSIGSWDVLGDALTRHFEDKSDHLSLLEQLTTIKCAPQEQMMDFNNRFQRTWTRIPVLVRPSIDHAFLYFSRSLNSDISVIIQSMRGVLLPQAYDIAVRAENSLIQAGKIAPRPPMPSFLDIQSNMPLVIPPLMLYLSFLAKK